MQMSLLDVGGGGLRVGEIVSVTKAKPKVGQWWQSAYVHGRGAAAAGGQLLGLVVEVGHARQKPTWPRPTPRTPEPPGHRPFHPSAGCLAAVRVRLIQGRSTAPGGGSALLLLLLLPLLLLSLLSWLVLQRCCSAGSSMPHYNSLVQEEHPGGEVHLPPHSICNWSNMIRPR